AALPAGVASPPEVVLSTAIPPEAAKPPEAAEEKPTRQTAASSRPRVAPVQQPQAVSSPTKRPRTTSPQAVKSPQRTSPPTQQTTGFDVLQEAIERFERSSIDLSFLPCTVAERRVRFWAGATDAVLLDENEFQTVSKALDAHFEEVRQKIRAMTRSSQD